MKNETIEETDQKANCVIEIYKGLGWMTTAFDQSLFDYFWLNTSDGHIISKLRAHLSAVDKDVDNHFPIEKKELLKKTVNEFIKVNSNYREANKPESKWYLKPTHYLEKRWHLSQLRQKGRLAFISTVDILANCKKTENESS